MRIDGSAATGIFIERSSDYIIEKPTVKNTRADGIHNTNASSGGRILDPVIVNVGDDCVAVVSYQGDTGTCSNIKVRGARAKNSLGGRLFTVVGGDDIEFVDCYGDGSYAAGVYVGVESAYTTRSINGVRFENVTIRNANTLGSSRPDHGALLILSERSGYTVANVTIRNLTVEGTDAAASRQSALLVSNGGTVSGILVDGADFLSGPTTTWTTNVTDKTLYKLIDVRGGGSSWGWELLGSHRFGAAAASVTIQIPPKDQLMVVTRVIGMSGPDVPALQFNTDAGANYCSRYITSAAGGTVLANAQHVSATMLRLSGLSEAANKIFTSVINNHKDWPKTVAINGATGTSSSAFAPHLDVAGAGEWVNTTQAITQITLLNVGSAQFGSGTLLMVFGRSSE